MMGGLGDWRNEMWYVPSKQKTCTFSIYILLYPGRALKCTCIRHNISPTLCQLVNKTMNLGILPNSLETARVMPLFKSGATNNLTNFRPISVLPLLSKIFRKSGP